MSLPKKVHITEVGARDGLQNEQQPVPAAVKIALCERLLEAGVRNLEATSFVSPKWIPQMADATEVMAKIPRPPGVTISVLTKRNIIKSIFRIVNVRHFITLKTINSITR